MHDTLALMGVSYHPPETLSSIRIVFLMFLPTLLPAPSLTTENRNDTIPTNKARASWKGPLVFFSIKEMISC